MEDGERARHMRSRDMELPCHLWALCFQEPPSWRQSRWTLNFVFRAVSGGLRTQVWSVINSCSSSSLFHGGWRDFSSAQPAPRGSHWELPHLNKYAPVTEGIPGTKDQVSVKDAPSTHNCGNYKCVRISVAGIEAENKYVFFKKLLYHNNKA